MQNDKISVAEIEELRQKAEIERQIRREIKNDINELHLDIAIPAERQMRIIRRGNINEIREMLQAYSGEDTHITRICVDKPPLMSPEAQLYIYENMQTGAYYHIYDFMLKKVPYTDELAKRMIDDDAYMSEQELSPEVQVYYLKYFLKYLERHKPIIGYRFCPELFSKIITYFGKYDFCSAAESYMIEHYLNPKPMGDSYVNSCRELVSDYIDIKESLHLAGERALIASGNHDLIMKYINIAKEGLKAEKELLERGNREEITAYFERYATL